MTLSKYKVGDLVIDAASIKVLMILESPHSNEYIHGHPAAGESALELTQFLKSQGYLHSFDNLLPIGCNIKALNYKPLGIVNCSHLPMNPAFYPCTLADDERVQVATLVAIKQSLLKNNNNNEQSALIKTDIFQNFAKRLTQVLEQAASDIIIVPCGDTAIGFMNTFNIYYDQPLKTLDGLPHPTEPEWHDKINTISLSTHIPQAWLP